MARASDARRRVPCMLRGRGPGPNGHRGPFNNPDLLSWPAKASPIPILGNPQHPMSSRHIIFLLQIFFTISPAFHLPTHSCTPSLHLETTLHAVDMVYQAMVAYSARFAIVLVMSPMLALKGTIHLLCLSTLSLLLHT